MRGVIEAIMREHGPGVGVARDDLRDMVRQRYGPWEQPEKLKPNQVTQVGSAIRTLLDKKILMMTTVVRGVKEHDAVMLPAALGASGSGAGALQSPPPTGRRRRIGSAGVRILPGQPCQRCSKVLPASAKARPGLCESCYKLSLRTLRGAAMASRVEAARPPPAAGGGGSAAAAGGSGAVVGGPPAAGRAALVTMAMSQQLPPATAAVVAAWRTTWSGAADLWAAPDVVAVALPHLPAEACAFMRCRR